MPTPTLPDLATLRAALAAARQARDSLQRAWEASQREVQRLRHALAQAEKKEKR